MIDVISALIEELLFTLKDGINPVIEIVYVPPLA